jgi:pantoate--beta-alanine ligase
MRRFDKSDELRDHLALATSQGRSIGFVPTMGALHKGHLSLVNQAQSQTDLVVVSIFVNPTQFNNRDDLNNYPRDIESDLGMLKETGVDVVFTPEVDDIYPEGKLDLLPFDFQGLDADLEGLHRPGHFQGMVTVVDLLFSIVSPDKAFFGLKDYQQYLIVKLLAKNKYPSLEIVPVPIVRERDGLALSSRNRRLSPKEREASLALFNALNKSVELIRKYNWDFVQHQMADDLRQNADIDLEYFEIRVAEDLGSPGINNQSELIALVAANVGSVRLIDNMNLS